MKRKHVSVHSAATLVTRVTLFFNGVVFVELFNVRPKVVCLLLVLKAGEVLFLCPGFWLSIFYVFLESLFHQTISEFLFASE